MAASSHILSYCSMGMLQCLGSLIVDDAAQIHRASNEPNILFHSLKVYCVWAMVQGVRSIAEVPVKWPRELTFP